MQTLRNITWWLIGLITLGTFTLVVALSNLLTGQFWEVPQSAIIASYIGLAFGLLNPIKFFVLGDTLIHEVGHAQMAALTFGRVSFIRIERDTSGVTYFSGARFFRRISEALVSLSGPISSSVVFVITARFISSELTSYWAIASAVFILLILVTTVRNFWGWVIGLVLLGVLYLVLEASGYINPAVLGTENLSRSSSLLTNTILAVTALNLGSAIRYSFRFRFPRNPGSDEFRFSQALFLPKAVGGHLILLIQLALAWLGMSYLLGWPSMFEIGRLI